MQDSLIKNIKFSNTLLHKDYKNLGDYNSLKVNSGGDNYRFALASAPLSSK
jgi:hypothetical protein